MTDSASVPETLDPRHVELLDCAIGIFLEKGFERSTIDEIAAAAAMAKRSVYARYRDKGALFQAAIRRAVDQWLVTDDQLRAAETDDLEGTLRAIAQLLVGKVQSPEGLRLVRITNTESYRMPALGVANYRHGSEQTIAYLTDLFRRRLPAGAIGEGAVDDAEDAALFFLTLVMGGPARMTSWGEGLDEAAVADHAHYCVDLFLNGVLPRA